MGKSHRHVAIGKHASSAAERARRAARFGAPAAPAAPAAGANALEGISKRDMRRQRSAQKHKNAIIGTSTQLEKPYFRLTSEPDPASVRPLAVLKRSLQMVKDVWIETSDYARCCDQLKSIRQDLTVQSIEDNFAMHVYETHARLALENGDLSEFSACQSRIVELRSRGLEHKPATYADEFGAYRVLHALAKNEPGAVSSALALLPAPERGGPCAAHALAVVRAFLMDDYCAFFRLYRRAPAMSRFLMDYMVQGMRVKALQVAARAYAGVPSTSVPRAVFAEQLAFVDSKQAKRFFKQAGAVFAAAPASAAAGELAEGSAVRVLDGKATRTRMADKSAAASPPPPAKRRRR